MSCCRWLEHMRQLLTCGKYMCTGVPTSHHSGKSLASQAVRNKDDLECLACPPKYRDLKSFWRYYTGAAVAPFPTVFGAPHPLVLLPSSNTTFIQLKTQ